MVFDREPKEREGAKTTYAVYSVINLKVRKDRGTKIRDDRKRAIVPEGRKIQWVESQDSRRAAKPTKSLVVTITVVDTTEKVGCAKSTTDLSLKITLCAGFKNPERNRSDPQKS
jgi:hypothetical protein